LFSKFVDVDQLAKWDFGGAIEEGKGSGGFRKLFPDELEHQKFVKVGIEQGPRNRVQFPIVVVCAARQVDNHNPNTLP